MPNQEPTWTILMYIAADSGLANFAIESLKQLKSAASKDVVVAAQVDLDGLLHTRKISRYIFDGSGEKDGSIKNDRVGTLDLETEMADPKTLTEFVKWAYDHPRCKSKCHCLIMWGHGPNLPEEAEAAIQNNGVVISGNTKAKSLYMSPIELGAALQSARLGQERKKLDILGIDACSMGMAEVACEVSKCADYMVASQEAVPDASFPYDKMLLRFRASEDNVAEICQEGPKDYKSAYKDYVFTDRTEVKQVTLSSIRPNNMETITRPVKELAHALHVSAGDPEICETIIESRADAKGFVGGIYVDLFDFCRILGDAVGSRKAGEEIALACKKVCGAIEARNDGACIVENQAIDDMHCHGLSIYFPYLTDAEKKEIAATPVKGGLDMPAKGGLDMPAKGGLDMPAKGGLDMPVKAADLLDKLRKEGIERTEQEYYHDLKFSSMTEWDMFIAHCWSRILAEHIPGELDLRYSGEQCARNLLDLYKEAEQQPKKAIA